MDEKLNNFYKNKNILITGGAGFIGSHVAEKLVELKANVTVIDNLSTGKLENLDNIKNKIKFIHNDITNLQSCVAATKNQEIIFHLAAFISVPASMQNPNECNNINVIGTFNLLESSRINDVKKFIFSSSSAVYGKTEENCSETNNCNPTSIYGFSKLMGEEYCKFYSQNFGLNTICLRYFNVFGMRQNPNGEYAGVIAKFKDCMKKNESINIYGDGKQMRDFIPVHDVVDANIKLAMLDSQQNGQAVNIAIGKSITLLELVKNLKIDFPNYSQEIKFLPARIGDIKYSRADINKYKKLISFL